MEEGGRERERERKKNLIFFSPLLEHFHGCDLSGAVFKKKKCLNVTTATIFICSIKKKIVLHWTSIWEIQKKKKKKK